MGHLLQIKIVLGALLLLISLGCAMGGGGYKKEYTRTERARMLIQIANGALVEGDPTGALNHLVQAEREDSSLPELYHSRALAYYAKHDLSNALLSAKKAVEIKRDYSDANNTLGKILIDVGKQNEAISYLRQAAEDSLYREAYKAWTNLGIISYRKGEYEEAERCFNRAIVDAPTNSCIAYFYRGHIKLRAKKMDGAISDYSEASRKLCAKFGEAHLALGMAYQQDHQFGPARKTFLEIQKRYPNTKLAEQALDQLRFLP